MLYPAVKLKRIVSSRHEDPSSQKTVDYCVAPDRIISFDPLESGGSKLSIDDGDSNGGGPLVVHVTASPDQIAQAIHETIMGQAELATTGSIRAQVRASQQLQKSSSGIALPRGINGGL